MKLTNLYATRDAFKVAISPSGEIARNGETEACEGTLLVSGSCRKAVSLRVSTVARGHFEGIEQLTPDRQLQILAQVKLTLEKIRAALVFIYEAAWRRATLATALKTSHRLQTLPKEVQAARRRKPEATGFRLGARANVLLAA